MEPNHPFSHRPRERKLLLGTPRQQRRISPAQHPAARLPPIPPLALVIDRGDVVQRERNGQPIAIQYAEELAAVGIVSARHAGYCRRGNGVICAICRPRRPV